MQEIIRQIRSRLRLAMDGVVSSSMREKGVRYKLNFGVTLPRLKEIATEFEKNADLAEALWQQDVRELKILATLLYPIPQFTPGKAAAWVKEIRQIEIAEQFCANLMQETTFAEDCAAYWIKETDPEYIPTTGFILYARLFIKRTDITSLHAQELLQTAVQVLEKGTLRLQQAALTALKRYGRISETHAAEVLSAVAPFQTAQNLPLQEMYNDLQFEFEYYL